MPRELDEALEARSGRLRGFARPLVWREEVASTNDVAGELALAGAAHGSLVVAGSQSRGRGRSGHSWFSPPGSGLYVSLVLRPDALSLPGRRAGPKQALALAASITLTAGVALAEAVRRVTGLQAEIKWPNDLVANSRKFCGILAEANAGAAGIDHVILGFGVNVRTREFPPELSAVATSLELELGKWVDEHDLLAESLACLAERLRSLRSGGFGEMLRRWRELSPSAVDARVEVRNAAGQWLPARTAGLDDDGALLVAVDGKVERVIAGELRWA